MHDENRPHAIKAFLSIPIISHHLYALTEIGWLDDPMSLQTIAFKASIVVSIVFLVLMLVEDLGRYNRELNDYHGVDYD